MNAKAQQDAAWPVVRREQLTTVLVFLDATQKRRFLMLFAELISTNTA